MAEPQGFEDAVLARIDQMLDPMTDAVAARMGMPPGAKKYSAADQLALYTYSPIADPAQRVEAMLTLKAQGKTNEEITDAVYPERRKLITTNRPRIDEQIAFAREMNKLLEQKAAEFKMPAAPAETMPGAVPQAQPSLGLGATAPAPQMAPPPAPATPAPAAPAVQPSILDMPMSSMMGG